MEESADFEMPSPKRIRLEALETEAALDAATPYDDMDDLYGTPPVQPNGLSKDPDVPAPPFSKPLDQKLFRLPGLGMLNEGPAISFQALQQQPRPSSISEAEQSSATVTTKDREPEHEQKPQLNGGRDTTVDDEHTVNNQTAERKNLSSTATETIVNGNATGIAKSGKRVTEAEAPMSQDVARSESELGNFLLDWHSSGTVVDKGIRLHGNFTIENSLSKAPYSDTTTDEAHTEASQDTGVGQNGKTVAEELSLGAKPVVALGENTSSTLQTFEELGQANKDNEEAEFELDSSPLVSDSFSDSSTDTSSSDDGDADGYKMLSPPEQARRLMAEDGGSDDDGKGKGRKAIVEVPRTLNEKPDELVPKPNVAVTEDMRIEELGLVENTVENLVLIKANTSGEYQVLESGSLLCLHDRIVIGLVSETLGRVQQPYYTVRFTNATAIAEAGIEKDTKIFYVTQHSTTVFTQPLKAYKGSDASNLHDEEVGDDELEFSDDEVEAEHKRQVKQQRMAKRNVRDGQLDGFSRGPQQRPGGPGPRLSSSLHPVQEHPPNSAEPTLDYDDAEGVNVDDNKDEDGLYTPLTRPSNLHEILSGKAPPMDNHARLGNSNRGRVGSRGGNRGRGDHRGRGGNRGMRDSGRGGKQNRKDHGNRGGKGQPYGHPSPPTPQTNGFNPSQINSLPPRPPPGTINHQQSTHQGNRFPHPPPPQSPIPPPAYSTQQQPQSHTHPAYPSQYPNTYNPPYFQQPPHQPQPSENPQQNYSQYHQPQQFLSHQGYLPQYPSQPGISFSPRPQYPSQQTTRTPSIPPGAHINPNFFKQQGQSASPQGWQQGYNQQQQQQFYPASNSMAPAAPASNAASLQDLLRGLGRGGHS